MEANYRGSIHAGLLFVVIFMNGFWRFRASILQGRGA